MASRGTPRGRCPQVVIRLLPRRGRCLASQAQIESTRLVHTQVRSVTSRTTVPEAAQLWPAAPRPRRCLQG